MSLTVKALNGDSTFLLTFQPVDRFPTSPGPVPGSFSVVLDPWLSGSSSILHPKFSIVSHTIPPCVPSLRAIPEPDLVVISQSKPDHCHQETLCQLPAHGSKTLVLAEPGAAKTIRGWRHFDLARVQALEKYRQRSATRETVRRFPIPATTSFGSPGEVTVAYIPTKHDLVGLHMAIGITYRPPTNSSPFFANAGPRSPPASPLSSLSSGPLASSGDRTISVIYAPHGVSYQHIHSYASSHLVTEAALPLTALLHSFDRVQTPWWLGGTVANGSPGGLEIAKNLLARCWIRAHDEEKIVGGVTAKPVRTRKYTRDEVEQMVREAMGKMGTAVITLNVGGQLTMGA